MIEVFFSEDAKYSMKLAIHDKNNMKLGTAEDVIFIGPHLDIGDISITPEEPKRYKSLDRIISIKESSPSELKQKSNAQSTEIEKLIDAAKKGETIRIWKSNAPFSACGLAFVCNQLENIHCDISVVSLENTQIERDNTLISYNHWGEVNPDDYYTFLKGVRVISETEKKGRSELWQKLKEENSPLRAVVNGQLISVPESFYDHLLIKNFPNNEFIVGELIADVLGKYPLGVSDNWYLYRMNQMIKENKLEITSLKNIVNPYQKTVKANC